MLLQILSQILENAQLNFVVLISSILVIAMYFMETTK